MKRNLFSALSVLILLLPISSWSQTGTATVSGEITDQSGAVLAGVHVVVTNVGTGISRAAQTNDAGIYTVGALPPGEYEVQVAHDGFQTLARKGIVLLIDQHSRQDAALQIGNSNQAIEVTATADQYLEPSSSQLHQVISGELTQELPLNGRNINQLISLNTGVTTTTNSFFKGVGVDLAINGQRSSTNSFLVDGLDNVEFMSQAPNITLQPDAVREFDVMTNSFSAEYGRSNAGVINVAMRSGTNKLHGGAFEFLRNNVLDANDYFSDRFNVPKLPFHFNQFGGTLGGPIIKNRLFFFAGYQGTTTRSSSTRVLSVPPNAWRTGDFSSLLGAGIQLYDPTTVTGVDANGLPIRAPFAGNIIPAGKQDIAGQNLLQLYPEPNQPGDVLNYVTGIGNRIDDHQGNLKIDFQATAKDSISGRWNVDDSKNRFDPNFGNIGGGGNLPVNDFRGQDLAATSTHVFSASLVNTFGYGYLRRTVNGLPSGFGLDLNQQIGIAGISSDPTASGLAFIGPAGWDALGGQTFFPQIVTIQSHQFIDNLSWVKGRHSLKIGGEYHRRLLHLFQAGFPRGLFLFDPLVTSQAGAGGNAIASMLMGFPSFAERDFLDHFIDQSGNEFGIYFQDDIRVNKKLTLNLGIRYDLFTPQIEAHDRQANFDLATKSMLLAGQNGNSRSLANTDTNNVGPRIGFAYTPIANGKTVLRGGYGNYYFAEQNALATLDRLSYNIPFYFLQTVTQSGLFTPTLQVSAGIPAPPAPDPSNPFGKVGYRVPSLEDSRVQSWNLDIQRELLPNTLFDVAYAGSHGNVLAIRNPNQPPPGAVRVFPVSPNIGLLFTMTNEGYSDYNSLQAKLTRRVARGLTFLGSYTWSKSTDNTVGYWPNSGISQLPQDSLHPNQGEHGLSDWDIRHNFIFSYSWEIPVGRGRKFLGDGNAVLDRIIGGWQMTGILGLHSGTPFTPLITVNRANTANGGGLRPDRLGDPNLSDPSVDRWFDTSKYALPALFTYGDESRNVLIGPGLRNFDMGLFKNFAITEAATLQFRAEFFNLTNTPHFGLPNPFVNIPQGGTITSLSTPPRQIQFGVKVNF